MVHQFQNQIDVPFVYNEADQSTFVLQFPAFSETEILI